MALYLSTTSHLPRKRTRQSTISDESPPKRLRPHIVSIHMLDDDSLLNIFHLYRPFFLGEDEDITDLPEGGWELWDRGRWWYQLTHICQRWRNLILGSASYLQLSLVCTHGTPVEDMLTYSPLLPLTVDYDSKNDITVEDERGILLALEQRHRVRHLHLSLPLHYMKKLVMAINEEFPILEYLIAYATAKNSTVLVLPETFQAPNLRHLVLCGFACPIRSRLHPTAAGIVALTIHHPSAYLQPNILLQWISFMPQLECLDIGFTFPVPNRDLRQPTHTTHVTLPNLRLLSFRGVIAYLEAIVCRITTPRLEHMRIRLFNQLTFSFPRLLQFLNTTMNLRFDNVAITFSDEFANVEIYSPGAETYAICVGVDCWQLDWQVSSVAQISNALGQVFSAVEGLALQHDVHSQSSEEHNDVDRIQWRNLLRSFSNAKTLYVEDGLVEELSRCLKLEDGELPLELLPELQKVACIGRHNPGDAFTSFINARQNAGRPVTLVCDGSPESPKPSPLPSAPLTTTSDEARNDINAGFCRRTRDAAPVPEPRIPPTPHTRFFPFRLSFLF